MSPTLALEDLRTTVRDFADRELAPIAAALDRDDTFPRHLWPQLGELAVLGPTVAEADGGLGLGPLEHLVIVEELSRASAAIGMSYAAHSNLCLHNLWLHGTPAQRARWVPRLLSGEHVGALAMSEADAGSDVLGSMRCAATRTDGGWRATGTKMWITNGPDADVLLVYMRTGPREDGPRSVTAFVVERGMAGFSTSPKLDKLGMRGSGTCELVFEDCFIPDDHVLGQPNEGARILMRGLESERLVLTGGPIGIDAGGAGPRGAVRPRAPAVRQADRLVRADAGEARRHVCGRRGLACLRLRGGRRLRPPRNGSPRRRRAACCSRPSGRSRWRSRPSRRSVGSAT